jgi:hypothetical protein
MIKHLRYSTHQLHTAIVDGVPRTYPAGTECWVTRINPDALEIEYDDGVKVESYNTFAEGLEPRPYTIWGRMYGEMCREIDEQVLGEFFREVGDEAIGVNETRKEEAK